MPSLDDLIAETMLATAARSGNLPLVPLATTEGEFRSPKPKPQTSADFGHELDEDAVRVNQIWRFSWDPSAPGTFNKVTIASRGMGMDYAMPATVYDKVEFPGVKVLRQTGDEVELYLDPAHMIGAWWTRGGRVHGSSSGLWQLDTRLDCSALVAFGYILDADQPSPLTRQDCDDFGDELIPAVNLRPRGLEFDAAAGASAWVCVGPSRYIVMVELVLCKENNDFVPGGLTGFARIHPHLMLWSNEDTKRVDASIILARPRKAMAHGGAMHDEHKALMVADTNVVHHISAQMQKPLPYTDLLYDYYEAEPFEFLRRRKARRGEEYPDHPNQQDGEVTLADARFRRGRVIPDAVKRNSPHVSKDPDIAKEPRQGQFDNVHIAPRMRLVMSMPNGDEIVEDDLVMLNMCLHDCTHMHVRWSAFLNDKIVWGWKDGQPYAEPGAPAVPENQTVFASLPNQHTLNYRAISDVNPAGKVVVTCHHGLAYAVDQWPGVIADGLTELLHFGLQHNAEQLDEPYWNGKPNDIWALFYFRVRYCGKRRFVQPRSVFEVETCMR